MPERSSLPLWPKFRRKHPRDHILATVQDDNLTTIDGEIVRLYDYEMFVDYITSNRVDVQCPSIATFVFLAQAQSDERAFIAAVRNSDDPSPRLVSIVWKIGNKTGRLFAADAWPEGATLSDIAACCAALDVGVYSSPSALGQAVMHAQTTGRYWTAAERPSLDLRAALIGGRAELAHKIRATTAVEIDRSMAYVAEAKNPLPIGAAVRWFGPDVPSGYPAYLLRCVVYIVRALPTGPFPLRRSDGTIIYPTKPGTYEDAWLTSMEMQDTLSAGCTVVVRDGWVWKETEPVLAAWADAMYTARANASTPAVAACIKKVAVSAIGWHAMTGGLWRVVEKKTSDQAVPLSLDHPSGGWVEPVEDDYPTQMLVWALWIWAGARSTLYRRQLAEGKNWLGYSNFDSLLLRKPSNLPTGRGLGEWKEAVLTRVWVDASRTLVSDEKDTRPGIPRVTRVDPREPVFADSFALAAYLAAGMDLEREVLDDGRTLYRAADSHVSLGEVLADARIPHFPVHQLPDGPSGAA